MKNKKFLKQSIAWIIAIVLWQLGAMYLNREILLTSPITVAERLWVLIFEPHFWSAVLFSFIRIVAGFLISLLVGITLATLSAKSQTIEYLLQPYITIIKAVPVASFIILCLIWLNSSTLSVFISFLMVLPIVYSNILGGLKATDKKMLEMAKVFKLSFNKKVKYIYLPHIKPYFASACTLGLGLAWKAGIAAEIIGIPQGSMGEKLYSAKVLLNTPDVFAWTVVIVIASVIFEKIFTLALKPIYKKPNIERS